MYSTGSFSSPFISIIYDHVSASSFCVLSSEGQGPGRSRTGDDLPMARVGSQSQMMAQPRGMNVDTLAFGSLSATEPFLSHSKFTRPFKKVLPLWKPLPGAKSVHRGQNPSRQPSAPCPFLLSLSFFFFLFSLLFFISPFPPPLSLYIAAAEFSVRSFSFFVYFSSCLFFYLILRHMYDGVFRISPRGANSLGAR